MSSARPYWPFGSTNWISTPRGNSRQIRRSYTGRLSFRVDSQARREHHSLRNAGDGTISSEITGWIVTMREEGRCCYTDMRKTKEDNHFERWLTSKAIRSLDGEWTVRTGNGKLSTRLFQMFTANCHQFRRTYWIH